MNLLFWVWVFGASMSPALKEGCRYAAVEVDSLRLGDIVVFNTGVRERKKLPPFVKRIIAGPGDRYPGKAGRSGDDQRRATLRPGSYFVLSDNPREGRDSRHYGPIRRVHIKARIDTTIPPYCGRKVDNDRPLYSALRAQSEARNRRRCP